MHVNLIPYNRTPGLDAAPSPPGTIERFAAVLRRSGITVTIRRTRGTDIDAACGQLRRRAPRGSDAPVALRRRGTASRVAR
jgi:23S rRNA (adenine2503-C2)-methyltransferase